MSILITGGRIITATDDYVADIYVEDDRVTLIGESLDRRLSSRMRRSTLEFSEQPPVPLAC